MPRLVVAHDVICPWCWVGRIQAKRLLIEFPSLELVWKGYELLPEGMLYTPAAADPLETKKPKTPTRFELLLAADGLVLPERTIPRSISRLALEGSEFALTAGKQEKYLDELYLAYWEGSKDIANIAVLIEVAEQTGLDIAQFALALDKRTFRDTVIEYDEPAHAAGIWNVPTFMFPEAWVAEQPYKVLRDMTERFVQNSENTPSD